ncbi:MAG: alpha/beta fold hydrolase [Actinomycetota bacterium]
MTTSGFVVAHGIRIYYVEEGEGPLVLLCHGFPELAYSWRNQMAPLADAGFRTVAIDLPGYGRSDKPEVCYDVLWLCACLAAVVEALGSQSAVVAGHDWGGLLAWPLARLHPERVAGVIGINTPDLPRPPVPPTEYLRARGSSKHNYILEFQKRVEPEAFFESDTRTALELFFKGPVTMHTEVFTDEVMQVYVDAFSPKGAMTPPLEYYRNIDRNWELMADHDGAPVEVPCLMISAANDLVLHPGLADGMEERVPRLQKVVIEDCGHWTQQEKPRETTAHMLAYLKSLEPWF